MSLNSSFINYSVVGFFFRKKKLEVSYMYTIKGVLFIDLGIRGFVQDAFSTYLMWSDGCGGGSFLFIE